MNYRSMGSTGITLSEIGFGAWGLGGSTLGSRAYGPTDDGESIAALRRALAVGVNFFDTADFYGFGHSETVLGRAFKEHRKQVIIASKVGFLDAEGRQDFSPAHIRRSLEGTLKRLSTDYLDIYQLHSPPVDLLSGDPEILGTMDSLRKEGLIRTYGVSLRSPEDGLKLLGFCRCGCIQVNFNLADQRARETGLFDLCLRTGTGIIARTPLCFGFLTGQYPDTAGLPATDHRRRWPADQVNRWHQASQLFTQAMGGPPHQTPAQAALRFCISYKAVTSAIPGMLTSRQVEENTAASGLGPFPDEVLARIQAVYRDHDFMGGR